MKPNPKPNKTGNSDLLRYAGLGMQLFVALGLSVFGGLKGDNWLNGGKPLLVWIFPLVVIIAMIYKLVKDTSKKQP